MSYLEFANKTIRVSSVVLRYLSNRKKVSRLRDMYNVGHVIEKSDSVLVTFADGRIAEFQYNVLEKYSNSADNTSCEYPFEERVPQKDDKNPVGSYVTTDVFSVIYGLIQDGHRMQVIPESEGMPEDHDRLRMSCDNVPDYQIIQGPFNGRIVNGIEVYDKIRALEELAKKKAHRQDIDTVPNNMLTTHARILHESSRILESPPVPIITSDGLRWSGELPDTSLPNFHEYVGYCNNFINTCYDLSVQVNLLPGDALVYNSKTCLTSYTGGSRVIKAFNYIDP